MSETRPRAPRIMVVEDEYLLADDLRAALVAAGSTIVGPFSNVGDALQTLAVDKEIDGAVLDIDIAGEKVFAIAEELRVRNVPFVFATGYASAAIPTEYRDVPHWEKPFEVADVARKVAALGAGRPELHPVDAAGR